MFLFLLKQSVNDEHDTFDSAVVCAHSAEEASKMHPGGYIWNGSKWACPSYYMSGDDWANPADVRVTLIGVADAKFDKPQVLVASFNAG